MAVGNPGHLKGCYVWIRLNMNMVNFHIYTWHRSMVFATETINFSAAWDKSYSNQREIMTLGLLVAFTNKKELSGKSL